MIRVNNLFDIEVSVSNEGQHIYSLYKIDEDLPCYQEEAGSAFTSSDESMRTLGLHLMLNYAKGMKVSILYAVALVYRGSVDIKWWHEIEARDTTSVFHQQLKKPEFLRAEEFDFIVPSGAYTNNDVHRVSALTTYLESSKVSLFTFINGDQPTTCSKCGARTDFTQFRDKQKHVCLDCGFNFITEDSNE